MSDNVIEFKSKENLSADKRNAQYMVDDVLDGLRLMGYELGADSPFEISKVYNAIFELTKTMEKSR